ncbi:hypothetical protein BBJ28_00002635 [Nothophytophthora sp. Chile5]|nr:hypothetical protein BBJ28_00002635 [Nothophytophthora sp. Chile5]
MESKWSFMLPWCQVLRPLLSYTPYPVPGLKVSFRQRSDHLHSLEQTRDALALLAAVAHVDLVAWKFLLVKHCGVKILRSRENVSLNAATPFTFVFANHFHARLDVPWAVEILECCLVRVDEHVANATYKDALAQIAAPQSAPRPVSTEIEIPVHVELRPNALRHADIHEFITAAWAALKSVEESRAQRPDNAAERFTFKEGALSFRSTFVLASLEADIMLIQDYADVPRMVAEMTASSNHFRISDLDMTPWPAENTAVETNAYASIEGRSQMLRSVLCSGGHSHTSASCKETRVNNVCLESYLTHEWVFEAMCSALVVTQSASVVTIHLDQVKESPEQRRREWQWLAYAFLSQRARLHSSIRTVDLWNVDLTTEDAEAVAAILAVANPEEQFVGMMPTAPLVRQGGHLEYYVKANASMRLAPIHHDLPVWRSSDFSIPNDVCGVKLLGDDGESEWVDVLVPSLGKCQAQRASLSRCDHVSVTSEPTKLTLRLNIAEEGGRWGGLRHLLRAIGPVLDGLELFIRYGGFVDLSWIIEVCPMLRHLRINGCTVDAAAFVRAYESGESRLSSLNCPMDDARPLAAALSRGESCLAKHLRQLRLDCDFAQTSSIMVKTALSTLEHMLTVNRSLEYLCISMTVGCARKAITDTMASITLHDQEMLPVVGSKLPMACKAAFLSIFWPVRGDTTLNKRKPELTTFQPRRCELEPHVISIIFGFAATCVVRQVFFDPHSCVFT